MRRAAALAVASLAGAASCSDGPGRATAPDDREGPPPAAFAWVGRWEGQGTGSDGDMAVSEPVELVVSFDHHEGCELCVRVTLGPLFDRDSLLLTDAVAVELAYVDSLGREHRLQMQRFSTGGAPGTTIIGRAVVAPPPGSDDPTPLHLRDIIVEKQSG